MEPVELGWPMVLTLPVIWGLVGLGCSMVTRNMEPVELGTLPVIWGRSGEQVRDPVTTLPSSTIGTPRDGKIGMQVEPPQHKESQTTFFF